MSTKARELAELSRTIIDTSDATAITINANEEVTLADDLFLADGKLVSLGANADLSLFHDGTNNNSHIQNQTGALITTTATYVVNNAANTENMLTAYEDGAVSLYHNNVVRLATSASGVAVTGTLSATDVLTVIDGSTSAPSISNAGDSNTGIYFPADDELGLLVGGSRKVHITSSGVAFENGDLTVSGTLNGITTTRSVSGNRWGVLPEVGSNGVLEIGRYLDFHTTDGDTSDYGARFDYDGSKMILTSPMQFQSAVTLDNNATVAGVVTSGAHLINGSSSAFGGSSVQGFNTDFLVDTGQGYSRHNSYHTGGSNHQFLVNATGSTTNTVALAITKDADASFAGDVSVSGSVDLGSTTDGSNRFHWFNDNFHSLYYDNDLLGSMGSAEVFTYYQNIAFRHQDSTNAVIIEGSSGTIHSGAVNAVSTITATHNATIAAQTNMQLALRDADSVNMRANFMVEDNINGGRGGLAIQATEAGVTNDRDLYLQPAGGRVGVLTLTPQYGLDVATTSRFVHNMLVEGVLTVSNDMTVGPANTNSTTTVKGGNNIDGFLGTFGSGVSFQVARHPLTGTFSNTGMAAAAINLNASSADSQITFFTSTTNNAVPAQRMRLSKLGDLGLHAGSGVAAPTHFQNLGITSTTGSNAGWTITTNQGTFNSYGAIDVAGIRNGHVYKFAFSGNFSSGVWYQFAKRSELASYGPSTGSGSEDGFMMYFRVYSNPFLCGLGEYSASRLTNMVWISNVGSNSVQEQHFIFGPALGHAPNAGQVFPISGTGNTPYMYPFEMKIHHRAGVNDHPNADQTFEIKFPSALTGLNPAAAGRQLLIFAYIG